MSVKRISIDEILVEKSRFSLRDFLIEGKDNDPFLSQSFEVTGIVSPVTLFQEGKKIYHLIDGSERIGYARQKKLEAIDATVLPETTAVTDIITLILCEKRREIESSTVNKIQFIRFALFAGAWESWVLDSLCPSLGCKPSGTFLDDCERIAGLLKKVQRFCHEKKFSLKQVLNMTYIPEDILLQLMTWRPLLQLTASTLDEMATCLKDYLISQDLTLNDFLRDAEVQGLMNSSLNNRDRTERLRTYLSVKRFPVLSETNSRICETVRRIGLPEGVTLEWDRTLENRNVALQVNVKDAQKWPEVVERLTSPDVERAIRDILSQL
jgi:hypothetical protein